MVAFRSLFPTDILSASLLDVRGGAGLLDELEVTALAIAEEDAAGRAWSRSNAYPGYTSYASLDDLPARATAFAILKRRLDPLAGSLADAAGLDLSRDRLRLNALWINLLKPGGGHSGHIHPRSVVSGTVYLRTPGPGGELRFEDPRLPMLMGAPPRRRDAAADRQAFVYFKPQRGDILMWESWLRHEVTPNRARTARLSVSFNYGVD